MRRRMRSTIKWAGTVLTVLLLVVWVGSAWWQVSWTCNFPNVDTGLWQGRVVARFNPPDGWSRVTAFGRGDETAIKLWFDGGAYRGFYGPRAGKVSGVWVAIPLWTLAMLTGLATGWLWRRDSRTRPGLCIKCGYDLRGNASGVCPECGAVREARESRAGES